MGGESGLGRGALLRPPDCLERFHVLQVAGTICTDCIHGRAHFAQGVDHGRQLVEARDKRLAGQRSDGRGVGRDARPVWGCSISAHALMIAGFAPAINGAARERLNGIQEVDGSIPSSSTKVNRGQTRGS